MRATNRTSSWTPRASRWVAGLSSCALLAGLVTLVPGASAAVAAERIAFVSDRDGDPEIFTVGPDGSDLDKLTNNNAWDTDPTWSPDATKIAFSSASDGDDDIYVMAADGTGAVNLTNEGAGRDVQPDWSPDGTQIVFVRDGDLYLTSATTVSTPTKLGRGRAPAWSPDGTKIAFARPDKGRSTDIYVMNADGSGAKAVTSGEEADSPDWSPDGTKIAFESVATSEGLSRIKAMASNGTSIVELPGTGDDFHPSWSSDGTKLVFSNITLDAELVVASAEGTARTPLASDPAYEVLPAWTPCVGPGCAGPSPSESPSPTITEGPTEKAPTSISLEYLKRRRRIKVVGVVRKAHPGMGVRVTLAKKKAGRWVRVGRKTPLMDDAGVYETRFKRPGRARRCRLKAVFPGDADHLRSSTARRFRC